MGREALEDIVYRAQLELYSQPLLVRRTTVCEVKTIYVFVIKILYSNLEGFTVIKYASIY